MEQRSEHYSKNHATRESNFSELERENKTKLNPSSLEGTGQKTGNSSPLSSLFSPLSALCESGCAKRQVSLLSDDTQKVTAFGTRGG
jgi:hypothetical protein